MIDFHRRATLAVILLLLCPGLRLYADPTYTYPDLVGRMTDLERLASLPQPGEQTRLASSYDRLSRYDAASDQYVDWDANADGGGFVRKEGNGIVMADITGPGCIWRTWSARAGDGHVKIYLDGSPTPAVDLPFKQYFDRSTEPFTRPNIVYTASKGLNNYTPIPFQKSCKIVADPNWGRYYHFNYSRFPAGTVVPTFGMNLAPADSAALDEANRLLAQGEVDPATPRSGQQEETLPVNASPGANTVVASLHGPAAITGLKVHLDLPSDPVAQRMLLRQLTIRITWDDQKDPAVWSPLGDFFGNIGGSPPHPSFPMGLAADGTLYAHWYMPFGKSARIEMGNDGTAPVKASWEVTHAPLDRPLEALAYFHAKWHRNAFPPARPDRWPDWTLLTTQGQGRLVGVNLDVLRLRGMWWGEGDEKFFVDGEKFPSTYGTGSEDYFGYAWGDPELFCEPYHGQAVKTPGLPYQVCDYRYHISDSVPFQQSLEAVIEKYLPENRTQYAAVVYWYLSPDGTDPYPELPVAERVDYWLHPAPYDANLIEGEEMSFDPNPAHPGPFMDRYLSGGAGLHLSAARIGDACSARFRVAQAGHYHVKVAFRQDPEGGIFQLAIGDQKLGDPIDFYAAKNTYPGPIDAGVFDLKQGIQSLSFSCVGNDPAANPKNLQMVLDYLKLEPAP